MNDPTGTDLQRIAHAGIDALRRGDAGSARRAFTEVTASGRATPQIWLFLAQSCDMQDDRAAAREALAQVLAADPGNPYALVMHGELLTRDGDDRAAVIWYDRAAAVTTGAQGLPQDLVDRLARAAAQRAAAVDRFAVTLHDGLSGAGVDSTAISPRFAEALAILAGQTRPYLQEPSSFYFPGLPQQSFYDPADFAWAAALEAATPAIAAEAAAVLADREGVAPYVVPHPNRPLPAMNLLNDTRWSAFYIVKGGAPVAENAARCPATVAALAALPIPVINAHSPMVLFSILAPHTHITAHNGMLNTRLICHLPLIVPPDCRLRVGNHSQAVVPGKLMIFDDSIEHEAWNDSDDIRVVLLFEIWRPELTAAERTALTAMYETVAGYGAG